MPLAPERRIPNAAAGPAPGGGRAGRWRQALREFGAAPVAGAGFLARAWGAIFVVEASLWALGYRRTLRWVESVPARRPRRRPTAASVRLGELMVRGAYRAHLFRGGCLPRSLVQYLLHRRDGTAARLVVGVRRAEGGSAAGASREGVAPNGRSGPGIEAHAWVEGAGGAPDLAASTFAPIFRSDTVSPA